MDYDTSELSEYLVKNKSLINKISNIKIWKYKFGILNQVFVFLLALYYQNDINNWIAFFMFLLIVYPYEYLNGLFKKTFSDKYELIKYKDPFEYRFYTPKKLATISRFKKFLGKRYLIIIFGGLALYVVLFLSDRGLEYFSINFIYGFFLTSVANIDHFINIIKEISVSRKFKNLLVSGLDEYSVALEIINQEKFNENNEYTSYDEYEKLVEDYDQNLSPLKKAEDFMKPIVPKKNNIKDE